MKLLEDFILGLLIVSLAALVVVVFVHYATIFPILIPITIFVVFVVFTTWIIHDWRS